jgi:hypothetical protein
MKKFILFISLVLFSGLFCNAFAEPKAMLNSINDLNDTINYTDTKRYIRYYIDEDIAGVYDRFNHTYINFLNNDNYTEALHKFIIEKKLNNVYSTRIGKYVIFHANFPSGHGLNKSLLYNLATDELIAELVDVKQITLKTCDNFYFFFVEKNDGTNWILNKDGIVITKTKNLNNVSVSFLDGLFALESLVYDGGITIFKITDFGDLEEIINKIEQNNLKTSSEIAQYFTKNHDNRFFSHNPNRKYNYQTEKYYYIINDRKTKEFDDIRHFYHYHLIKANGLYGVMGQKGNIIISPQYDAILINDENNIELCKKDVCEPHKLNETKDFPFYIEKETQNQKTTPKQFKRFRNYEKIKKDVIIDSWVVIKFPYINQRIKPLYERIVYVNSEQRYRLNFCNFGSNTVFNENGRFKSDKRLDLLDWLLIAYIFIYRAIMISLF